MRQDDRRAARHAVVGDETIRAQNESNIRQGKTIVSQREEIDKLEDQLAEMEQYKTNPLSAYHAELLKLREENAAAKKLLHPENQTFTSLVDGVRCEMKGKEALRKEISDLREAVRSLKEARDGPA